MDCNKKREYGFLAGKNQEVTGVIETAEEIQVYIKSKKHPCKCPDCNQESTSIASTYKRKVQDTPIRNKRVILIITASKYRCKNSDCQTKVFCEELPNVKRHCNRTVFLDRMILSLSIFLSDYMTSLVLGFLNVKVSHDSVRKLREQVEFREIPVKNIGIDDVALRKGQQYATAIYDLDTGELLCLLEGRSKEETVAWLKENRTVQTVARDRASAYAAAVNEVLPEAVQVADRFHLIDNLISVLKDLFYSVLPSRITIENGKVQTEKPKTEKQDLDYNNSDPVDKNGEIIKYDRRIRYYNDKDYQAHLDKRKKRVGKILKVKELRSQGKTLRECSEILGISLATVRNYQLMPDEKIQKILNPLPSQSISVSTLFIKCSPMDLNQR